MVKFQQRYQKTVRQEGRKAFFRLVLFGADEGSELEQVTEEDRAYNESRFSEVRDAIFANPYQKVWGGEGEPALPRLNLLTVSVNLGTLFDRMTDLQ
jgi:hypothetical protein